MRVRQAKKIAKYATVTPLDRMSSRWLARIIESWTKYRYGISTGKIGMALRIYRSRMEWKNKKREEAKNGRM